MATRATRVGRRRCCLTVLARAGRGCWLQVIQLRVFLVRKSPVAEAVRGVARAVDMAECPAAGPEVRAEQEEAREGRVVREEPEEAREGRVVREEPEEAKAGRAVPEARGVAAVLGPSIRTIRTTTRIP